ncbi:hypothetical protein LIER_24009 [Lithospermum erythrorhizon]|uniref:Integrase catalytic domain-containing protein n=1 Tax=Lithospermum erythrorhizon TaxID=34254 RepID=A0AAV3QZT3_LITER
MLVEIHDGWCRSHIGARSLAIKVTRVDYYWPTLVKDSVAYVKRCDACQRLGNSPQFPTSTLTPVVSLIPFAMWGIDLVGKLPNAKGGVEFAIVGVDYFSKWIETAPLKKTKGENVTHFLWKNILTRFGIPKILVYDNAPQLEGQILADFCEKFGIEHRFALIYYPQSNGQVEVMNHIIFKGIKKNLLQSGKRGGNWVEELPTVLWSFRYTPNQPIGEAPFSLVYGTEAILGPGTYELEDLEGKPIPRTWHASKLSKYYV